jgi:hypothetical protein
MARPCLRPPTRPGPAVGDRRERIVISRHRDAARVEREVTVHKRPPHTFTFEDASTSAEGPFVRVLQSGLPFGKSFGTVGA